jgi:hypothetical protein
VTFGNAENFVDGLDPGGGKRFFVDDGREDGSQRLAKTQNAEQDSVDRLRFCRQKRAEPSGAILRDQTSIDKESDEFVPGKVMGGGREVGEIKGQTTGDKSREGRRRHITRVFLQSGYSRESRVCKEWVET